MYLHILQNIDLLSFVFLIFPFLILFYSDQQNKEQLISWWFYIQCYNYAVLSLFIVYQIPLIPPETVDESQSFVAWQDIIGLFEIYAKVMVIAQILKIQQRV